MGLSLARNRGIEEARGEIVAFTDDDCEAPEDWLSAIHAGFERYPAVGVILGSLLRPKQRESRAFSVCPEVIAQELLYDPATGTSTPEGWGGAGGNFAFRREVLQAVGPFDELLGAGAPFPATEDTDYLIRVEALGWQMYSTPTVVIHHKYGYRYGLGAVYRLKRNYALGNGALAAKLALSGDPRGAPWLRAEIRNATIEPLRRLQWASMPMRLLRLAFFTRGYYACRTRCRIAQGPTGPGRAVLERASL